LAIWGVNIMPYEAFVCPECGAEVMISMNFCKACGVNLINFPRLEKKTFYYKEEICWSCHKPGGVIRTTEKKEIVPDVTDDSGRTIYFYIETCTICNRQRKIITKSYSNTPEPAPDDRFGA